MYPDSLLWWLGGIAVILGILGLIGFLALYVDSRAKRWQEKRGREHGTFTDDSGRGSWDALIAVLVALVAIAVVAAIAWPKP